MSVAEKILRNKLPLKIRVEGGCMAPFIKLGDYIIIKPVSLQECRVGDIIAHAYIGIGNRVIGCHRLLKIEERTLITKGDNSIRGYVKISPQLLLGKVIAIEHNKIRTNLQTAFQRFIASKIAWMSLNMSRVLIIIRYLIEIFRAPHLIPIKFIHMIRRNNRLFF